MLQKLKMLRDRLRSQKSEDINLTTVYCVHKVVICANIF